MATRLLCLKRMCDHPENTGKDCTHSGRPGLTLGERALPLSTALQPTQERPAWMFLVVTVISTVSGTSASSDHSHKSLGLDRLQRGEDSAHQLLEGGASATFSMCRWLRPSRGQQIGHLPLCRGHRSFFPEGRTLDSLF